MWDEDTGLGDALRTELAEQAAPPVRGGLAEVVGRGRRRRRTQQVGAALAVAVAVAGTAVVAATLGGPTAMPPANRVTTSPSDVDWPRADLPALVPYGTWTPGPTAPPPSGRPVEPVPRCASPGLDRTVDKLPATVELQGQMARGLRAVAGAASVGALVVLHLPPTRPGTVDAYTYYTYTADVTDANGTGSVVFSVGSFTGDPLDAADEQAFDEFNCDPPKRQVRSDGTVLQIYAWQPSEPFQSMTQVLRIYEPGGTLYQVTVRNFGSPDFTTNRAQPESPNRVGAGRASLPLTERQLADLGVALVTG